MSVEATVPRQVLVDTGAWYALADRQDANHEAAVAIQSVIVAQRPRLFTTNFIIDETYTLLRTRLTQSAAVRFLDYLRASTVAIVRISTTDESAAEDLLRRFIDKRFSYTDATSFVVIEKLGIATAFTFDRNFTEYGGVTILTAD
jgi:predicted nucleic acid-binding protein